MARVNAAKRARKIDRGDFQTPARLAAEVCAVLRRREVDAASLLEPTCGEGALLVAGAEAFPRLRVARGLELNADYAARAAEAVDRVADGPRATVRCADFFHVDWDAELSSLPEPILVLGNPPWVTSAGVTRVGGSNVPTKHNADRLRGIDALMGASNFDISEWMIWRLVDQLEGRRATVAMLCKTSVARKVLARVWGGARAVASADLYAIDARRWFGAAVDAALLVVEMSPGAASTECALWSGLDAPAARARFGWRNDVLVADVGAFERTRHLAGRGGYTWRSGVKHDCSRVMELRIDGERLVNGLGESVDLEPTHRFPMRKGSELAAPEMPSMRRHMVVPQRRTGEDTAPLCADSPRTWAYLCAHGDKLDARASSIYKGRSRFSVFGVGDYSFAPWKVAIAGLYKRLAFRVVGPHEGRPVMLDDTCYFLACEHEARARALLQVLTSARAAEFFAAFTFWDAKRPITSRLLSRLDIDALARELGVTIPA